jgi:hypothetical protein
VVPSDHPVAVEASSFKSSREKTPGVVIVFPCDGESVHEWIPDEYASTLEKRTIERSRKNDIKKDVLRAWRENKLKMVCVYI